MRASVLRDGRMVLRDDVAEPVPGQGQVLVGVKACGICGSDLHFAKYVADVLELNDQIEGFGGSGGMNIDLNRDIFMGHEFSAEVLEAGTRHRGPEAGHARHLSAGTDIRHLHRTDCVLQQDDRRLCRTDAVVGDPAW